MKARSTLRAALACLGSAWVLIGAALAAEAPAAVAPQVPALTVPASAPLRVAVSALPPSPTTGPLIFLGDRDLPPWESLEGGEPRGASVDLANAIGRVLGRPVEVRLYEWADAQRRLLAGEGHALTQMARTPERDRLYDLSRSTGTQMFALFVPASVADTFDMANLSGRRIGVTAGGLPRQLLATRAPTAELVVVANLRDGTARLLRGDIDALAAPAWAQLHLLKSMGINSVAQLPPFHHVRSSSAVRKGDTALLAQLDSALQTLESSGEDARIIDRWSPKRVFLFSADNLKKIQFVGGALGLALLALAVSTALLFRQRVQLRREVKERHSAQRQAQADEARLRQLQNLTAALGRAVLPADVGAVLVQHCRSVVGTDRCHLLEFDEPDQFWRTLAIDGFGPEAMHRLAHVTASAVSPLKPLLDHLEPWHAADAAQLATLEAPLALKAHYGEQQAMYASPLNLSAPTRPHQAPIGALVLAWPEPHPMADTDKARIEIVAKLFAQALERTRMRAAERRALGWQHALQSLNATLNKARTVDEAVWSACTTAMRAMDALNASIALFDQAQPLAAVPAGTALTLVSSSRLPAEVSDELLHLRLDSDMPVARAATRGLPVYLPDRAAIAREAPSALMVQGIDDVQAVAAVPLLLGAGPAADGAVLPLAATCLGGMAIDFAEPRTLDHLERRFLRSLGDVTARAVERCRLLARLSAALSSSEAERLLLDGIIDQFPVGLLVADAASGLVTRESAPVAALLGRSALGTDARGGASSWTARQVGSGVPLQPQHWPLRRALREGVATTGLRLHIEHPDGQTLTADCWATPVRDSQGRLIAAAAMLVDVTEHLNLLDGRRENELRLQLAMDAASLGTWDFDPSDASVRWSPSMYTLLGLPVGSGAETAESFMRHVLPSDRPALEQAIERALREHSEFDSTFRVRHADGRTRWLVGRGRALRLGTHDAPLRMIGVNYDVTPLMQVQQAMQATAQQQDEFLAMLSHELRNPLAPIVYATQLLERAGDRPDVRERAVASLQAQAGQLGRLVDELSEFSRLRPDRIKLQRGSTELDALIDAAVEAVRPQLERQHHTLQRHRDGPPQQVWADPARVTQMLVNLLGNAAKYTSDGGCIAVHVGSQAAGLGAKAMAVVQVVDNGVGIAPQFLPHVFDLFAQGDASLDRSQGGLGIGMAIVKRLAGLHGGSVEAHSAGLGSGATFTLKLPLADPR